MASQTVGELIDILAKYPTDLPITVESVGYEAVGYSLLDNGVVDDQLTLTFINVLGDL